METKWWIRQPPTQQITNILTLHSEHSCSQFKKIIRKNIYSETIKQHLSCVGKGSTSAVWYKTVTDYRQLNVPSNMPRDYAVILHRLRLGYKCNWEIAERILRECSYCQLNTEEPLLHYLLPWRKESLQLRDCRGRRRE